MCCFSLPVKFVAATRIFARPLPDDRQALVYAMQLELDAELAMVLPIPVPVGAAEDAVTFVDLSGYPRFFEDLARAFPPAFLPAKRGGMLAAAAAPSVKRLTVHHVGRFEASFVPSVADMGRLDERFRLPPKFWSAAPAYGDWGFVVVKLAPRRGLLARLRRRQTIHPLAFTFPRRDPAMLFFPTLHVHDGQVHARARFDHELYAQPDEVVARLSGWTPNVEPLATRFDAARGRGLVDVGAPVVRDVMVGELDNRDAILWTPAGVGIEDLTGRGRTYRYDVRARAAVHRPSAGADLATWCRALREGLAAFEREHATTFRLRALDDALAPHCLNGPELRTGRHVFEGAPVPPGGPGRLELWLVTPGRETQWVTFGFDALPDAPTVARLQAALVAAVAAAA